MAGSAPETPKKFSSEKASAPDLPRHARFDEGSCGYRFEWRDLKFPRPTAMSLKSPRPKLKEAKV
jgi:hypothetical protein